MNRREFLKEFPLKTFVAVTAANELMTLGLPAADASGTRFLDTPTGQDWLERWQKSIIGEADHSRYCDKEMGEELGWLISPFLNGFYYGHLATGDPQWVERLVDWTDATIRRGIKEPDGFTGWPKSGTGGLIEDTLYTDSLLGEAMLLRPVVLMADHIRKTPALSGKWGGQARSYLKLAEATFEKWDARGCWREVKNGGLWVVPAFGIDQTTGKWTSGYDQRNTSGFSNPANKQNAIARWLLALHDVTGKSIYRERAGAWFQLMKSRMRTRLWRWFEQNVLTDLRFEDSAKYPIRRSGVSAERRKSDEIEKCGFLPKAAPTFSSVIFLAPPSKLAPRSSLVHMFETVCQKLDAPETAFVGKISNDGAWTLDFSTALAALADLQPAICSPPLILGTAFSFVHLLDFLAERNLQFQLPENSRVMETGGYKNRSRSMPKEELHALITEFLGVPRENIICEYGMSELSSQAYEIQNSKLKVKNGGRGFQFPPWARVQIISPETGREVADGETGLIRIFDLANVFSVAAIQTEDLGIRRGENFELVGRAQLAEPRGCSLMAA